MKRTTVLLPDRLYERLRREAVRANMSMSQLIRTKLELRTPTPTKLYKRQTNPLLNAAGICSGRILSENIDEELYGI